MSSDPYEGTIKIGQLVREAAKAATYDEAEVPDFKRLNDIRAGQAFIDALVDTGCMITGIPKGRK